MKRRVVILGAILISNNVSAMLSGTTTPAPGEDQNKNNSKTNLVALSQQTQSKRSCCAFLDCIFIHLGYLQPQTAFDIPSLQIWDNQQKYCTRDED